MALRPRDKDPHIPATSGQPSRCRYEVGEEDENGKRKKCGAEAHNWISGVVYVMDKAVKVKLPVCNEHLQEIGARDDSYSTN